MRGDFWQVKSLDEMNEAEWESVCDGCARCCMIKLQDEPNGDVEYTAVACRYLDQTQCRCTRYAERHELVPDCVVLTADTARRFDWLPTSWHESSPASSPLNLEARVSNSPNRRRLRSVEPEVRTSR